MTQTVTVSSSGVRGFLQREDNSLKIPERIRNNFLQTINRAGSEFVKEYEFQRSVSWKTEQGQKRTRVFYTMAPIIDGSRDATSPLYCNYLGEEIVEEVAEETPEWSFCSFLQQLMDRIVQFARNFFAGLRILLNA